MERRRHAMLREQFIEVLDELGQEGLTIYGRVGDPENGVSYYIYDGVSIGIPKGRGSDHFNITYHAFREGQMIQGGKIIVPYYEIKCVVELKRYIEREFQKMFPE